MADKCEIIPCSVMLL